MVPTQPKHARASIAPTLPKSDEQTIYLGNGWTLRARVQNGLVPSAFGGDPSSPFSSMMGANYKVIQYALITETQPHGFNITNDDARTLLAWRDALGSTVLPTAPEKTPPASRPVPSSHARTTLPRRP
jgi:hypothetical protein